MGRNGSGREKDVRECIYCGKKGKDAGLKYFENIVLCPDCIDEAKRDRAEYTRACKERLRIYPKRIGKKDLARMKNEKAS